ncbi:hypothetical protein GGI04_003306 [Coemansia thaxteri]|uniref:FIT family protein scs3 n=1 Tax=Coemansia thaxteri TaxID=2663907 RepID=A0A9W8BH74_9FUNG|nr:hypothetical protein H4R26_003877 [Coemansia thaxteri]KAJ2002512.1 hypothetical protein GGI04_003306 [Coemansia thaxteri]KAJ2467754.1 hypothetical protein GGI02_003925 [Coemansia sp. RSA 2322]KAJ2478561.1 hypothetical protein EV174_004282 [Coemansia sp. RSA 2320]
MPPAISSSPAALVLALLLGAVALGLAASWRLADGGASVAGVAVSPWASKRNPLNVYFAKLAWAWTSALFGAMLLPAAATRPAAATLRATLRYALATIYWLAMTAWFFGPPLFDRLYVRTGGACRVPPATPGAPRAAAFATASACRAAGGAWAGGHDVSGHCFLMLHSALFLTEEILLPMLFSPPPPRSRPLLGLARRAVAVATLGLVAVWLLMLFFTAKYFHGVEELLSGSLLGVAFWVTTYRQGLLQAD